MGQPRTLQTRLIPTKEWVACWPEFYKTLDVHSFDSILERRQLRLAADADSDTTKSTPDAAYKRLVAEFVDALFVELLNLDPTKFPHAKEDCIKECLRNDILNCKTWCHLKATKNPRRYRSLGHQVVEKRKQHMLPFPEVGMFMIAKLILQVEGGLTDIVSGVIKEHFVFERAGMAAVVYDRYTCSDIFAINGCPRKYSFPLPSDHLPLNRFTTSADSDEESNSSDHQKSKEPIILSRQHSSQRRKIMFYLPRGKEDTPYATASPGPDVKPSQTAAKHTPKIPENISRSAGHVRPESNKRRRTDDGSGQVASLTSQTEVPDDGRLIMSAQTAKQMFEALRVMQTSLSGCQLEAAARAYNDIISTLPKNVQHTEELAPLRAGTMVRIEVWEKRAQGFGNNLDQITKVLEELDEFAAEKSASVSREHRVLGKLTKLLLPLEDESE